MIMQFWSEWPEKSREAEKKVGVIHKYLIYTQLQGHILYKIARITVVKAVKFQWERR